MLSGPRGLCSIPCPLFEGSRAFVILGNGAADPSSNSEGVSVGTSIFLTFALLGTNFSLTLVNL